MLRGKIFERNEEIRIGGQICPQPVCLGLKENISMFFNFKILFKLLFDNEFHDNLSKNLMITLVL